jgi:hypothetical protein
MKKTIIHVTAGDEHWTPTQKELNAIANKFRRAIKKANGNETPVVPTRSGVRVEIVEFDPMMYATTGYISPVTMPVDKSNPIAPFLPGTPFQPYVITTTSNEQH